MFYNYFRSVTLSICCVFLFIISSHQTVTAQNQSHQAGFSDDHITNSFPLISLKLSGGSASGSFSVYFTADGKIGIDSYDAYQLASLSGTYLNFYTETPDGNDLVINHLPDSLFTQTFKLPVVLKTTISGNVTLTVDDFSNIPSSWSPVLYDLQENTSYALSDSFSASMSLSSTNSEENRRFILIFDTLAETQNAHPETENSDFYSAADSVITLGINEITFTDDDSFDQVYEIMISSVQNGSLFIDVNDNGSLDSGELVSENEAVNHRDLEAGRLHFKLDSQTAGFRTGQITFTVSDGLDSSNPANLYVTAEQLNLTIPGTLDVDHWSMLTLPAPIPYSDFLSPVWTQGIPEGASTVSGISNVYFWNESEADFTASQNLTDTAVNGNGFVVYLYEDDDHSSPGTDGGWPKNLALTKSPEANAVAIPITNTDSDDSGSLTGLEGWNLIGNPFGTALSVDSVITALQETDPVAHTSIYIWSPEANSYVSKSTGSQETIAPFQSFFIRLLTPGVADSVRLFNKHRSTTSAAFYKSPASQHPTVRFSLGEKPNPSQEISFLFTDEFSGLPNPNDIYYLAPLSQPDDSHLFMTNGEQRLSLQHLEIPNAESAQSYPFNISFTRQQATDLKWEIGSVPEHWNLFLQFADGSDRINLREQSQFTLPANFSSDITYKAEKSSNSKPFKSYFDADAHPDFQLVIETATQTSSEQTIDSPYQTRLFQNYPNPFNPTTTIRYSLSQPSHVRLRIFSVIGQEIVTLVNQEQVSGEKQVLFNGSHFSSGIYLILLETDEIRQTMQMILMK
jgi:hypothetical protein